MATNDGTTTRYASYLLRLRLVWNDDGPIWMASLDNTATGSHRAFPNVEALTAFLLAEFGRGRLVVTGNERPEEENRPSAIE